MAYSIQSLTHSSRTSIFTTTQYAVSYAWAKLWGKQILQIFILTCTRTIKKRKPAPNILLSKDTVFCLWNWSLYTRWECASPYQCFLKTSANGEINYILTVTYILATLGDAYRLIYCFQVAQHILTDQNFGFIFKIECILLSHIPLFWAITRFYIQS